MKQFVFISGLFFLFLMNWGCSKFIFQKKEEPRPPQAEIEAIKTHLNLAENSQTNDDSTDTEIYYLQALEKLDSLSTVYPDDSLLIALQGQVSESYDDYLDFMTSIAEDTLNMEEILADLNELYAEYDSLPADTVTLEKIPLVTNQKVERAIQYFTAGKGRKVFTRWLTRAGRYEKLVKDILRKENAPEDLFYLAMIESGLNPKARSYARAVGLWQFIYATGKAYGLTSSWWYDDRQDPVKASHAAARHLLDLYERFGDWYLAIAGYNFNPKKIEKRLEKYNVEEFWDLPQLPRQTINYVPTYLAALTIAGDPAKYGFEITPEPPLEFDTVTVKDCVDLNVIAEIVGSSFFELKELNPAILRWCTPPDQEKWMLYLPVGSRETFVAKYPEIPKEKKMNWVHHRIRSGETLSTIARKYSVSAEEIKRFNNLKSSFIRAGQDLVIPIPQDKNYYQKYVATQSAPPPPTTSEKKKKSPPVENVPGRKKQVYTVKKGDSLWDIAVAHQVTISEIREWNGLGYSRLIQPGQKLNIWLPAQSTSTRDSEPPLAPATESKPVASSKTSAGKTAVSTEKNTNEKTTIHIVRSGDTLWDIAQAYNVSIGDLKKWNGKRNNMIKPGEELKILHE